MISAATVRPEVDLRSLPSPASRTSSRLMLSPALPASFSTTILSPGATRYCLPPVRTIANIGSSFLGYETVFRTLVGAQAQGQGKGSRGKRAAYGRGPSLSTAGPGVA